MLNKHQKQSKQKTRTSNKTNTFQNFEKAKSFNESKPL